MYNALISAPYLQLEFTEYQSELAAKGINAVLPQVTERLEEHMLLSIIHDYDGIVCGDDRITARVLDAARRLKVIVKWGTGTDSIDKEYARSKGIPVFNTPNAFTEPVSDSAMAFMLSFARQVIPSDRILKQGGWSKKLGFCLCEKKLGIIGVGNIGRAVARKAQGFGIKIFGNDIREIPAEVTDELGIAMVSLDRLLAESDIISINCDLNPTSRHLIGRKQFALMRPEAILINTARGPIVSEPDLIEALASGKIAGAGLDVFEEEPLPPDSPLRAFDNCILSAHSTNGSRHFWKKVHRNSLNRLYEGLGI